MTTMPHQIQDCNSIMVDYHNKFREYENKAALVNYTIIPGSPLILFMGSCRILILLLMLQEYFNLTGQTQYGYALITDYHYIFFDKFSSPISASRFC